MDIVNVLHFTTLQRKTGPHGPVYFLLFQTRDYSQVGEIY